MANAVLIPPTRPINLLCSRGHELPAVTLGRGESVAIPCGVCGQVIRTSWAERDGAYHPTWAIVMHAREDRG